MTKSIHDETASQEEKGLKGCEAAVVHYGSGNGTDEPTP